MKSLFIDTSSFFMSIAIVEDDKIFVINGPGSFTGVRVGVTVAKTLAWSLKIDVIPISSLAFLATTPVNTKYVQPVIDARRGYVYTGTYESNLNIINNDTYMLLSDIDMDDITIVSHDSIEGAIKPRLDILKIINKYKNNEPINAHLLKPNYLKKTEAEEKLESKGND